MKIAYIPFNNKGVGVDWRWGREAIEAMMDIMQKHLDPGEKCRILLYVSHMADCFVPRMDSLPPWVSGIDVVYRQQFSQEEADKLALEAAHGHPGYVVCFRLLPRGLVSQRDMENLRAKAREHWGWAYCLEAETVGGKRV